MAATLALGADHAGYPLKEALKQYLEQQGIPYHDYGCYSLESCDYPDIAAQVAKAVEQKDALQGILCCGSGVGMAMMANRSPGVRAVVVHDVFTAEMSRRHNDANVICFGCRVIAPEYAQVLLDTFLHTDFEGGRHQQRVRKLSTTPQGDPAAC